MVNQYYRVSLHRRTNKAIVERLSRNGRSWQVVHVERPALEDTESNNPTTRAHAWAKAQGMLCDA